MRLTTHQIHPYMDAAIDQAIVFLRSDLALGADVAIVFRGWFDSRQAERKNANGIMQCHDRYLDSERYEISLSETLEQTKAFDTLAHEMRHIWQYEHRLVGPDGAMCETWEAQADAAEWYCEMPDELDAIEYAAGIAPVLLEKFTTDEWRTGMPGNEIEFTDGTVYRFHWRRRRTVISMDRYYKTSHGNARFESCEGEIQVATDGTLTIPENVRAVMDDRAITEDEIKGLAV
jgi:hypothetical protein